MYEQFRRAFENFGVISVKEILKVYPDFDRKNLVNWQKKGYITKVRNKFYVFSNQKIEEYHLFYIANKIYNPSYVSMESALDYYGVIPEGVYCIQSISTLKTNKFESKLGVFSYQTVKKELNFGYKLITMDKKTFRIASIEKAILDFLYLRSDIDDYLSIEALRWSKYALNAIDPPTLEAYLSLFDSPTLTQKINHLKTYRNA